MADWQYEGRYELACLTILLYQDQYYILSFPGCSGCYEEVALEISAVAPLSGSNTVCGSSNPCPHQTLLLGKQLSTTVPSCNSSVSALLKTSAISRETPPAEKEKQLLMFISLAYWNTTGHASSREHYMLDGSGQFQLVGRSFLKPCSSTLSSLMLSLSASKSDLILVKQSL